VETIRKRGGTKYSLRGKKYRNEVTRKTRYDALGDVYAKLIKKKKKKKSTSQFRVRQMRLKPAGGEGTGSSTMTD